MRLIQRLIMANRLRRTIQCTWRVAWNKTAFLIRDPDDIYLGI